ncbi:TonB-dependent receptor plug domain-containing protein [Desulfovibrio sp. OttesenSCG-928-M14]|nr:TonB-dependent receptor plug domain-containing protein [Desulfovibrio sp. OttesenSCG-928-M14]
MTRMTSCDLHRICLTLCFACLLTIWLDVQSSDAAQAVAPEPAHTLDPEPVVSTPIIEGNVVSRYGIESTVVTSRQLADMNAQDITSALRRTPGVTIARFNPVGSFGGAQGGGIFIRGMGSSRPGGELATLIDGVSISNPIWGHPILDIVPIDPASAIHVYKAAQPNLFGNAFAAIDVSPKRMTEDGFKTRVSGQYGKDNTFFQSFEHGGKKGPLDYYVGQSFKSSDGHRDHSAGQLESYYARLGYQAFENWNVSWFGIYSNNFAHDPGVSGDRYNNGRYGTWDGLNILTLANKYENAKGHLKFYQNTGEADWDGESSFNNAGIYLGDLRTRMEWETWGLRGRENFSLWEGGEIVLGFDYDNLAGKQHTHRNYNNTDQRFSRHKFELWSGYASLSHMFGSKDGWHVIPSAGIRQYWHSEFDDESSPHAGLIVGYRDTELHFGYSRSVVYPSLNVVILSEVVSTPIVNSDPKGWKNLSAEVMDHFEVGLSHTFNQYIKADVTAFWDEGKDRYRMFSKNPSGMPPAGFTNIDSYHKYGFESTLTITPTDDLSFFAGAAFLETSPYNMPFAPKWTLSGGMNWRFWEDFQISADVLYRSSMYTDSWSRTAVPNLDPSSVTDLFLMNAKLSYFFECDKLFVEEGEVFVVLENITDRSYEYSPGYQMPGISWTIGITLNF